MGETSESKAINKIKKHFRGTESRIAKDLVNSVTQKSKERESRIGNVINEAKDEITNAVNKFKTDKKTDLKNEADDEKMGKNKIKALIEKRANQTIAKDMKLRNSIKSVRKEIQQKENMVKGNLRKNFMKRLPQIKSEVQNTIVPEIRKNLRREKEAAPIKKALVEASVEADEVEEASEADATARAMKAAIAA